MKSTPDSRTVMLAAIQLTATPAPLIERLVQAAHWIEQAAQAGAQLLILPELFNLGYAYADENYARAEHLDGETVRWLKAQAVRHHVHLAGTLLLREDGEIFNALLLIAPDGQVWRYDKQYPWGWERAYFRGRSAITIARTALGDIGLLVCWDVAHPALWARYAGQVDLLVVCSCPPDVSNPQFHLPDGKTLTFDDLGPLVKTMKDGGWRVFGENIERCAAWLGVPVAVSAACGAIDTALPDGRGSLAALLPLAPQLIKHWPQADRWRLTCALINATKIVDATGAQLSAVTDQTEGYALAQITLPAAKPHPIGPVPRRPAAWLTYLASDVVLPAVMSRYYRQHKDRR